MLFVFITFFENSLFWRLFNSLELLSVDDATGMILYCCAKMALIYNTKRISIIVRNLLIHCIKFTCNTINIFITLVDIKIVQPKLNPSVCIYLQQSTNELKFEHSIV